MKNIKPAFQANKSELAQAIADAFNHSKAQVVLDNPFQSIVVLNKEFILVKSLGRTDKLFEFKDYIHKNAPVFDELAEDIDKFLKNEDNLTSNKVEDIIEDALNGEDNVINLGDGWGIGVNLSDKFWDTGVQLFKKEGEEWKERGSYLFCHYGETILDVLEQAENIISTMAKDIMDYITNSRQD